MRHVRRIAILLVLLTVAVGGAFWFGWLPIPWRAGVADQDQKTLAVDPADQEKIHILGWLEPAGGFVDINGIPGDRLETLLVSEDTPVTKGQPLAYLESRTLKQLQLDTLKTQVQEAVARREAEIQLAELRILTAKLGVEKVTLQESEAESLQEKIKLLEDNLAMAEKDYDRMHELRSRPQAAAVLDQVVSEQEIDRQRLVVHRAKAELSAAKAGSKRLQATQSLAAKAAEADLKVAMASKDEAAAAVPLKSLQQKEEMARVELSMTEIKSPCDGRVMKVFMRAGETVSQKPILRMANLDRMVALAEVYEVDIKRVHVAQTATIHSQAFYAPKDKDGLRGKVVQISRIVNTPELKSLNPFAKADRHVISIRIEIAKDDCPVAAQFVDMQVDVELHGADAASYPSDSPK